MIRPAVKADLPKIVELGKAMHEEAERLRVMKFVPAKVYVTISGLIDSPDGLVLLVEEDFELVGGIAAMVKPHWFSTDLMAYDLALFVRPDRRGSVAAARLLKAYKDWAKEKGAVITQFGISTGVHLEATSALVERLGFQPSGLLFDATE